VITFAEYKTFAFEEFERKRYGQFVYMGGRMLKKHPPATWRPIEWCDQCRADITGGLHFDQFTRAALCSQCKQRAGDGERGAFATIGIIWDG
jgi:hypothetical protein